jgi:hypothetical protein
MPTIKSGAFAQQCYSSHPLSLTVKTLILFTPPVAETAPLPDRSGAVSLYRLVVSCDNCTMRHRFTIDTLTSRFGQTESVEVPAMNQLSRCVAEHPTGLRVSGMDVVSDSVRLMCGECRRSYDLTVATVETYQK